MSKKVSIRSKIFFIVLIAILPTLIISFYASFYFQQEYILEQKDFLLDVSKGFVNEQRMIARSAEEMLIAISRMSAVQKKNYAELTDYFISLMGTHADYAVILATDENFNVVASGVGQTNYSLADRLYLKNAKESGVFTVGTYIISRSTGISAVTFTLPVHQEDSTRLFLIASWDLKSYSSELSLSRLSSSSHLQIFDETKIRLFSSRGMNPGLLGDDSLFELCEELQGRKVGEAEIDGIPSYVTGSILNYNGRKLFITLSMPKDEILAASRVPGIKIIVIMLLGSIAAFCFSLLLAHRLFIRRIETLNAYTVALASGDLSVRSDLNNAHDELTTLIISFNKMAAALQDRTNNMQKALEEKEYLLSEIKKRVGDNLQVLSSIVSLQFDHTENVIARTSLQIIQARIMALSIVYETIYLYSDVEEVLLQKYCSGLCEYVISLYSDIGRSVDCEVTGIEVPLPIETAMPLALVLNEVLVDCLQQPFILGQPPKISIFISKVFESKKYISIRVSDSGIVTSLRLCDPLGLNIIQELTEQLGGTLTVEKTEVGFSVDVRIPDTE